MNICERTENLEKSTLSKYASISKNSLGRARPEEKCIVRTDFQRDKDRIVHSKAFRRLMHKTQVFVLPKGDHYRTRLTHSIEVSQVARTVARALQLNEDLTETIALAHDLGHSPFGHDGESVLNDICPGGFKHFKQSARIVNVLEKGGKGLNLTFETVDGILNHTRGALPKTLEGQIVRICDKIAYLNHDIDDCIRAGILKFSEIPHDIINLLGENDHKRIWTLVNELINNSQNGEISLGEPGQKMFEKIHTFMYSFIYNNQKIQYEAKKIPIVIESLFVYYKTHPEKLPDYIKALIEKDGVERAACDYISGMTDQFAIYIFKNLVLPKSFALSYEKSEN